MNEFNYLGLAFKPLRTLKGKASDFFAISKKLNDIKITPKNWNHAEFYKSAEQNGAGEIDLFEVNGIVVILCQNCLFQYK